MRLANGLLIGLLVLVVLLWGASTNWWRGANNNQVSPTQEQIQTPSPQTPTQENQPSTPQSVSIDNMSYIPATITVKENTLITWTNNDTVAHTVTSDTGIFSSPTLNPGDSFRFTITTAGTYGYYCTIHPNMKGTINVEK